MDDFQFRRLVLDTPPTPEQENRASQLIDQLNATLESMTPEQRAAMGKMMAAATMMAANIADGGHMDLNEAVSLICTIEVCVGDVAKAGVAVDGPGEDAQPIRYDA